VPFSAIDLKVGRACGGLGGRDSERSRYAFRPIGRRAEEVVAVSPSAPRREPPTNASVIESS
jgi:hypothetical protein